MFSLSKRPRRNRKNASIRALTQETYLLPSDLIATYFVIDGKNRTEEIVSMPSVYRYTIDLLLKEAEELVNLGIPAIALFPAISKELKDDNGSEAFNPNGLIPRAIRELKKHFPELLVINDVALDPYSSHGHDGLVSADGRILNDETVKSLAKMSVVLAEAGSDMVAPSDMMDGRIKAIRHELDVNSFQDVSILSYSAKYASAFYRPFRDALNSSPKFGDKKTYQMNPANSREALLECALDEEEGADFLMIKPALSYLDIIYRVKQATTLPVAAYQVSGEYAMLLAASRAGSLDFDASLYECTLSIKRAGADAILTYGAKHLAKLLKART